MVPKQQILSAPFLWVLWLSSTAGLEYDPALTSRWLTLGDLLVLVVAPLSMAMGARWGLLQGLVPNVKRWGLSLFIISILCCFTEPLHVIQSACKPRKSSKSYLKIIYMNFKENPWKIWPKEKLALIFYGYFWHCLSDFEVYEMSALVSYGFSEGSRAFGKQITVC